MKRFFLFTTLLFFMCLSFAQTRNFRVVKAPTENPVANQTRKAVVIGMSDYGGDGMDLSNTINDATDMANVLTQLGFEVTVLKDNDLQNLENNLNKWYNSLAGSKMAVFYYAGHGVQVKGQNYLLPVDFPHDACEPDVKYKALNANEVVDKLDAEQIDLKLLILDACRTNPFKGSCGRGIETKGLTQMEVPVGTYYVYATAPGTEAQDGGTYNLPNGVFTYYLKQEILKKGASIDDIVNSTTFDVSKLTNRQQVPYKGGTLTGNYYFTPSIPSDDPTPYNPSPAPVNTQRHSAEPDMVFVQGGTFWMGCSDEQGTDCFPWERPLHSVTLSNFYIGKYEVTQKQWQLIMGSNQSNFKGDNLPVENVSWNDVQEFIRRLNEATGKQYRLPTEAEWEYACRGGARSAHYKYSGSNNPNDVAWFSDNSGKTTHPVGTKQPNELGIYDMSGNVWEWCSDWSHSYSSSPQRDPMAASSTGSVRVFRGGDWEHNAMFMRVSSRYNLLSDAPSYGSLGFRLACSSK